MNESQTNALPRDMAIVRGGASAARSPDGIASAPFWVEMLLASSEDGEPTAMRATLDPGVISHWHTHPLGQVLYVLAGVGQVQRRGGRIEEVRAGDCIWFAPDEPHWHGAAASSVFSYLSVQAVHQGTAVHWLEPVETSSTAENG
jgi:quercetin dioxygenase-like cupin family protein